MTFEEIQARLQYETIQIAKLPPEEYEQVMENVQRLNAGLRDVAEAIMLLGAIFGLEPPEDTLTPEAAPPLCATCANPCAKASHEVQSCHLYSTLTDRCRSCANWDVDTCQLPESCIDGQHYVELVPEEADEPGELEV